MKTAPRARRSSPSLHLAARPSSRYIAGMVRIPLVHRLRFSLRTFLVTLMLLSLIGSNLYVSFKWRHAQSENQRLRDELGYITIDDPTLFYVREIPTHKWGEWRWRIYVPSDAVYCLAKREVPETGVTRAEHIYCGGFPSGERLVDLRLERLESSARLSLVGSGVDGSLITISSSISREQAPWLYDPNETEGDEEGEDESAIEEEPETQEVAGSGRRAHSCSFDAPVVLLRLRHPRKHQSIHEDCDGLMIWIEKR